MDHQGAEQTLYLIRDYCYWPEMPNDVEARIKQCENVPYPALGISLLLNLEVLAIDFTLLEPVQDGRESVLVMTDVFTKFMHAVPSRDQRTSIKAKLLLKEWFSVWHPPWVSTLITKICKLYDIKSHSTPYHLTRPAMITRSRKGSSSISDSDPRWSSYCTLNVSCGSD